MITYEDVTKTYNDTVTAIDDVSFHVNEGETVVLLGPSGCGKTTLLRMVNRLESITKGDIKVNGNSITSLNEIDLRRNIGYVIQSNGLFPNMTIEKNVTIVPDLLGWDRKKKKDRFQYLMDLVGLNPDEFGHRYPHELSGGQQQRVGVIRALAADPPVMLMDEPFGALDPIIRERVQDEFLQIQREVHKTILFVSHDIDEAIKMGDKIALMQDGQLMQYDSPTNLLTNPSSEFVSQFVGQDRALKSLSLLSLADLIEKGVLSPAPTDSFHPKVEAKTSVKDALSMILNQDSNELIVVNAHDQPIGMVALEHIQGYLSQQKQPISISS